jgi:hypothetical protein
MERADRTLGTENAEVQAELLLGALDGLAFRWALDSDFDFATYARLAANKLVQIPASSTD